jgi:hypothetical protein
VTDSWPPIVVDLSTPSAPDRWKLCSVVPSVTSMSYEPGGRVVTSVPFSFLRLKVRE